MPKFLLLFIALFWTGFILFLCLVQSDDLPSIQIENLDKLVHGFFHCTFTILWFLFFRKQFPSFGILKLMIMAFSLSFFFGIGIEFLQQTFTTTRQADVLDVCANSVGAMLGVVVIAIGNKFNLFQKIFKD